MTTISGKSLTPISNLKPGSRESFFTRGLSRKKCGLGTPRVTTSQSSFCLTQKTSTIQATLFIFSASKKLPVLSTSLKCNTRISALKSWTSVRRKYETGQASAANQKTSTLPSIKVKIYSYHLQKHCMCCLSKTSRSMRVKE